MNSATARPESLDAFLVVNVRADDDNADSAREWSYTRRVKVGKGWLR